MGNVPSGNRPFLKGGGYIRHKKSEKNPRIGRCYELAGRYILNTEGTKTRLVHGIILSPFPDVPIQVLPHAWIEENGEVYDLVLDARWPKDAYYNYFKAVSKNIFSREEFREKVLQTGYWNLQEKEVRRR